jgi:biotin carboxyl carrier protein
VTFDVEVRGRRHHVEVLRTAGGDQVSIDGRPFSSHMGGAAPFWSLLVRRDPGTKAPLSYEVAFDLDPTGTLLVNVDGTIVPVRLVDRRRSRSRGHGAEVLTGSHSLRAPMPGRIVRLLVAAGDKVAARQPLAIMEAMKMENELHVPLAGTVTTVDVQAGDTVEAGTLLLVVTSESDTDA